MGTSFTQFKGYGFWARDPSLEVWLLLLAGEIDRMTPVIPDWLVEAQQHWQTQAQLGLIGCICAGLDDYLTDEQRVGQVAIIARAALGRLEARGPILDRDDLNSLGAGGPNSSFTRDVEARHFTAVGEAFIALLLGKLETDATTSPVL